MKEIQPVNVWSNGQMVQATLLNAWAINVVLGTSATFYYNLLSEGQARLAEGNLTMTGEAYQQWTVDSYAWDWIAEQLNLTIVGDYVPPVVETSEEVVSDNN
jgi:hypothetical protein